MNLSGSAADLRLSPDLPDPDIAGALEHAQVAAEGGDIEYPAVILNIDIASHVADVDVARRVSQAHFYRGRHYDFQIDRVLSAAKGAKRTGNVRRHGEPICGPFACD